GPGAGTELPGRMGAGWRSAGVEQQGIPSLVARMERNAIRDRRPRIALRSIRATGLYANPAFRRAGVNGACRNRMPVASKIALASAAAVGRLDDSPAPPGGTSG